jgi:VIT1/CCC1 family predicted Fe2+/Mn2+ transporter
MVLIYQAKGLGEAQARDLADRLMANKETALDTLVREELGIDPTELGGSPWTAAASSFGLFAVGAVFPVAPFFWLSGMPALLASNAAGGVALILIGAGTRSYRPRVSCSALRQLLIGFAAAGVTYGIGHLVGVSIGGEAPPRRMLRRLRAQEGLGGGLDVAHEPSSCGSRQPMNRQPVIGFACRLG